MLTIADVYALARGVGLSHNQAVTATAISLSETEGTLDPAIKGDVSLEDSTWGPSVGLWQIRSLKSQTGTGATRDASHLTDPRFNARSMFAISSGGTNWRPWTTYTNGAYGSHLAAVRRKVGDGSKVPQGSAPKGTTTADPVAWYSPGNLAGDGLRAVVPGLGLLQDGGGKVAGKVLGDAFDLAGVRSLVITSAVVLGGLFLIVAGAAVTAKGANPLG